MWQYRVFCFVFSILTGSLYQIVLRMPNRRRLTLDEMHVGIDMLEAGSSQRYVADHLDVSQSVVSRMWNRYQMNGNAQHRHGGGRAKATSAIQDRYIGLLVSSNHFRNATSLPNDFQNATNVRLSTQTIRNRLHSSGLMARRPAIRIPFTPSTSRSLWTGHVNTLDRRKMTGPLCFLGLSQSFALTFRIDVLECGEHVTNVLHQFVLLNTTFRARAWLWYWPESACKGKRTYTSLKTVH